MHAPPMLHCRREAPANHSDQHAARQIAKRVLAAFGFEPQHAEGSTSRWLLPTCRKTKEGNSVLNWIDFPDDKRDSHSIHIQCCTEHAVLQSIAAAEIALQWREAGLIKQYCDRFRWGRHLYDDPYRTRIQEAMRSLDLPYTDSENGHFTDGPDEITPDTIGTSVASQLAHYLTTFDASVVLFGSRATGHHRPTSDIDLMVLYDLQNDDTPPDDEEPFPKMRRAIGSFLLQQAASRPGVEIDVNIVEQSGKHYYTHHSQNLQQPQPNGLLFPGSATVPGREQDFGLQTRNYRPDLCAYPVHFTSTELWVVKVFDDNQGSFGKLETVDMPPCKTCR